MESSVIPRLDDGDEDVLSSFDLYPDADFDMVRQGLVDVFSYPATIEPVGSRLESVPSVLRAVELTHLTLGVIRFGTDTRIRTGPLPAYNVLVPVAGELQSFYDSCKVVVRPGIAAVCAVGRTISTPHWRPDAEMLCIKIRPSSLQRELGAMIGRPVASAVRLEPVLDLTEPAGRSWLSVLRLLLLELASDGSLSRISGHHREQLERLLMSSLLRAHSHDLEGEVRRESAPPRWATVKRVVEAIEAAPEKPWSLAQLAEIAGVTGRRLQQAFQAQLGMSPMAYLQDVRLEGVHRDLLDDVGQVSEVSTRWGFTHLGRFAGTYRARYGESPSETRRRGRSIIT